MIQKSKVQNKSFYFYQTNKLKKKTNRFTTCSIYYIQNRLNVVIFVLSSY